MYVPEGDGGRRGTIAMCGCVCVGDCVCLWQYFGAAVLAAGLRVWALSFGLVLWLRAVSQPGSTFHRLCLASVSAPTQTHSHTHTFIEYFCACVYVLSALWLLAAR